MSQLKFGLKIWNNILIGGGRAPWAYPLATPLLKTSKNFPERKNQASYADFAQSCRNYAGNRKNPDCYRLSSQVLLHPKLRFLDFLGLKTFLVLRPQFFKSLRPSKVKTKTDRPRSRPRPQLRPRLVLRTTSLVEVRWQINEYLRPI